MSPPYVVVRKSQFVLELVTSLGTERFPVAIGSNPDGADKKAEGDCRTPEGEFEVASIDDSSAWEHEGRAAAYGPFFVRLSCPPWTGIGIHGTDEPGSVGTRSTLGCVRLRNADLLAVVRAVVPGTRVVILP